MIPNTIIRRACRFATILACTAAFAHAQQIQSITPKGRRQVSVTASASGRSVLQWNFDERKDGIWTSLTDSRPSSRGRVTFMAPRHQGLLPRFRVLDGQPATPGASLFNTNRIRTLKIEITKSDLKKMLANLPVMAGPGNGGNIVEPGVDEIVRDGGNQVDPGDPGDFPGGQQNAGSVHEYVPAVMNLDGGAEGRVGIRIKGNSSLANAVIDKRENYPLKIDVNYFKSGQSIDGIRKFNLHPVVSKKASAMFPGVAPSVIPGEIGLEEYLSYGAFRAFGVPASRTGWVDVYLNGKYLGLYTLLEQMDAAFMDRTFGAPGGNTYKPEGEYLDWKGRSYDKYPGLNWKGGTDSTHASIIKLIDVINHKPVARYPEVIDVQSIFNYAAGYVALGNWDSYEALAHNYVLHEGAPGRFYMLPWDMNLSQSSDPGNSIYGKSEPLVNLPEGMAQPVYPLTDRLYKRRENDLRYRATLKAFIEGPASSAVLNARIDDAVALLGTRIHEDAVKVLRDNIEQRISKIKELLNAPASP